MYNKLQPLVYFCRAIEMKKLPENTGDHNYFENIYMYDIYKIIYVCINNNYCKNKGSLKSNQLTG
jgi:hypothetical protein